MDSKFYHAPVKRSIRIEGHATSISLEPLFWNMLREAADRRHMSLHRLVALIDVERIGASPSCGLAGAVRLWLVNELLEDRAMHRPES